MDISIDIRACVSSLWFFQRSYLKIRKAWWVSGDKELSRWMDTYPTLLENGRVVWAHIIQANEDLFKRGWGNLPGEIVYDPSGQLNPEELGEVGNRMFDLKGTKHWDDEVRFLADHLANELTRVFGRRVPPLISEYPLRYSTIYFERKHFPNRRMSLPFFPVLISDACAGYAMVLPSRWWPQEFVQLWLEHAKN